MEIWKDVAGYEGIYEVSTEGNVRSVDRTDRLNRVQKGKMLRPSKQGNGYMFLTLHKDGKQSHTLVHRLVATAFIPNPNKLTDVNHLNENKADNRAVNLEWVSHKENMNYGTGHVRGSEKQGKKVAQMTLDGEIVAVWKSMRYAAYKTKTDRKDIYNCCNGRRKTAKGYRWGFVSC